MQNTGEMDGTVMTNMCHVQRFLADHPPPEEEEVIKKPWTRKICLTNDIYERLLQFVRVQKPAVPGYSEVPHPEGSLILQKYAAPVRHQHIQKMTQKFIISPMAPVSP